MLARRRCARLRESGRRFDRRHSDQRQLSGTGAQCPGVARRSGDRSFRDSRSKTCEPPCHLSGIGGRGRARCDRAEALRTLGEMGREERSGTGLQSDLLLASQERAECDLDASGRGDSPLLDRSLFGQPQNQRVFRQGTGQARGDERVDSGWKQGPARGSSHAAPALDRESG